MNLIIPNNNNYYYDNKIIITNFRRINTRTINYLNNY